MSTYAIGDLQGCYEPLQALLQQVEFDPARDRLWFVGDLVNRGPDSLQCLRFVKSLGERAICVLGNHDLHLLAVAEGLAEENPDDHLGEVLHAPDLGELMHWLRQRPMLHHDEQTGYTMIHAGFPPQWDLDLARACARELETVLCGDGYHEFLENMYGNKPNLWSSKLQGMDRLRFITNAFTRLRYCDRKGKMYLKAKGPPGTQPEGYLPWFQVQDRASRGMKIIFGHWSALGLYHEDGVYALDSGCLWGNRLSAMRLEDGQIFSVACAEYRMIKS